MTSTKTLIMSLKIILMSTGVIFIAILISFTLPSFFATAASEAPNVITSLKSWLRPPYLYFIINAIIITILASSRLHHHHHQHHAPPVEGAPYTPPVHKHQPAHQHDVISLRADIHHPFPHYDDAFVKERVIEVVEKEVTSWTSKPLEFENTAAAAEEVEVDQRSTWSPPPPPTPALVRQEALECLPEFLSRRPPASSRFGHHRKTAKASVGEGGKALRRVAKPKKHDTLESTWKAITEGRHIPLTRHLKKSDTWENSDRQIDLLNSSPLHDQVKKSQTFTDRTNHTPPPVPVTKLKKEPSLGKEELNRRVEAFINKFNEEMRLQRQQSVQQFMEMINRAA